MARDKLKIATCQFAVSSSIKRNAGRICNYIEQAKKARADIVHFSECALSGYVGTDFGSYERFDWGLLKAETEKILVLAGKLKIWVVLGSSHRLTEPNKPYNCLYLISDKGRVVDRYDKRFCTSGDLHHYSAGSRFVYFDLNGVRCSLLICFDLRFPEIYRELYKNKVQCVFQSFYNARQSGPSVHTDIMRQTMQCRAATNKMWVSMSNCSAYYSPYPSCVIQPDGKIARQLKFHRAGIMTNTIDANISIYDPMEQFRDMAIKGRLDNGLKKINDPRSKDVKII